MGDVGRGDDSADPAGVFRQGEADQGDRAGREGLAQHGAQGDPFAGDGVHLRPAGPADAEAGAVDGRAGADAGGQRDQVEAGAADAATDLRSPRGSGLWRRLRRGAALRQGVAVAPFGIDGADLCAVGVLAGRGLSVRLEPRVRGAGGGDDQGQGRARPAVPQPNVLRPRLSAREPGDGVRRPRPGIPAVPGCLPARHLRQHEDGGADRPHRQGARVQPALRADVWPLPGRTDSMHAGSGMG